MVLLTKLLVPEIRGVYIKRRSLIERLYMGITYNHKLTLISAAAGYGKTTLVVQWLKTAIFPIV